MVFFISKTLKNLSPIIPGRLKYLSNINLVTPTPYIPLIKEGLILAKEKGLKIPVVYNTSGYENRYL